ncbi:MAG: 4Fe-4S binding protein [Desulfarculus sp.]|nr:4Fe-4S binding protein [Pseudomonadota bacterium]MBV1718089.1 4Fe-4S binding protein [Desulfarculus sp.]MBU4574261.1 4Fe-4S binding protein [Pseudomonadota bacterium]MBU4597480.1 4Fe-4S binding protein [Pseudomonadota bacterium]MBV1737356.1 4Fe-4S binding protein [Desulfarculus sp.]
MPNDIFRALQKRLDKFSMGFPATESGIEIKILEHLFSPEDAELFLSLSHRLEPAAAIAARLGQDEAELTQRLEDMAGRGLLFRLKKGDAAKFGAIPFVHGLFEFQVKDLSPELAAMVKEYSDEAFDKAMQQGADYFLRTIPVGRSVDITRHVAVFDDAVEILKSKDQIVITDCICRKKEQVTDGDCGKPLEACFMFGSMGQYYLDRGMGRVISLDEGVKILEKCREAGLVTQPATTTNPSGMCNCCGDCCGVLGALRKHPKPAEMVFSNWFAQVSQDDCTGCETCLERCQMDAIVLNDDGLAGVRLDRCIGCGLCVVACPTEAIELLPKPEDQQRVPPASAGEQMMRMAQKRGLM